MQLKWWLLSLWLLCLTAALAAEVEIKQAVGEIIRQEGRIFTGPNSRAEVEFPAATVRIGSNADFRYASDYREMSLNRGTILLSARDDAVLYAGVVTMKTSQGDFQCSNIPGARIKVVVLDGKVVVYFAGKHANLRYGESMEIPYGATKMPRSVIIDLKKLFETSLLLKMGPLQNQWRLERNIHRQNPPPPPIANSPSGYEAAKTTSTAMGALNIERQQALQAQALANQQLLEDRRAQRLAEQSAARAAVDQAAQRLEAKRLGIEFIPGVTKLQPAGNANSDGSGRSERSGRPDFGRPGRPDIGRPGRPGLPGPGLPGGPLGSPIIPP